MFGANDEINEFTLPLLLCLFLPKPFQYVWSECGNQRIYTSVSTFCISPKAIFMKLPADKSSYICLMSSFKMSVISLK